MTARVLVAYATKYGATQGIAQALADTLLQAGMRAELKPAAEVDDVSGYDAVVLGSAVYAGSWLPAAADFLKHHAANLARCPTWLFSSGPTGEGDPVSLMRGWRFPEALKPLLETIHPRDVAFFHGAIWLERLNVAERLIIKALKAPTGDYRDWTAVRAWGQAIAAALQT